MKAFLTIFTLLIIFVTAVMAMDDRLNIEITHEGTGTQRTKTGDKISMHYRGTLPQEDGKEFDSSYKRGDPLSFKLGAGQVIKGWDEGLQNMAVGEKRTLYIPAEMGYGDTGFPGAIPPNSPLKFETELVRINDGKDEL